MFLTFGKWDIIQDVGEMDAANKLLLSEYYFRNSKERVIVDE
ncbi:hypothetical protein [Rummeliibacillus pycnus]|nr:hypothetical protein [Rummeliibacillus pycnus]